MINFMVSDLDHRVDLFFWGFVCLGFFVGFLFVFFFWFGFLFVFVCFGQEAVWGLKRKVI